MKLNRDFKEFIECLNDSDALYMIIGGYAVAHHGRPRYTKDIDIWLRPDQENGAKVVNALIKFGFGSLGLTAIDFSEPDTIIQLGYEPQRIDLLTSAQGLDFDESWNHSCIAQVEGIKIRIVSLTDLLVNKKAVGRPQDLADVDALEP